MKLFRKKDKEIEILKKGIDELKLNISDQNQLYKATYNWFHNNILEKGNFKTAVKKGYEGNVSVFGIINILSTIFAEPEDKLYFKKGDKKEEVDPENYGITWLKKPNHYQSWTEFKKMWASSYYTTGNSMIYAPILEAGNNKGRLIDNQLFVMPAAGVQIFAKDWRKPIDKYGFDMDGGQTKIDAFNILHERFAPNLDYTNGKNFYGVSPVLVALKIILSQNEGYDFIANTYAKRMPPFVFFSDSEFNEKMAPKERDSFHSTYKKHYQGDNSDGKPMYANKGHIEKIGFDSFRDLQVLDTLADGKREFATALGVPSQIFNDIAGTTFNNQQEALKRLYFLRTKPDWKTFYDSINSERIKYYHPDLVLEPNLTDIEALKSNLEMLAKIFDIGVKNKSFSRNEFREAMGHDLSNADGMNDVGDEVLDNSFPSLRETTNNLNDG